MHQRKLVSWQHPREIQRAIESDADNRVADLHVWRVGPHHLAAIVSVVTHEPRDPAHYKRLLAAERDLVHVTVEVLACQGDGSLAA
jgi:Co/Zn/Cd efflux system component